MDKGFTFSDLFTGRLTWRALAAMVAHSRRDTALMRTLYAEQVEWSATEHLLADVVDLTATLAWLQSDTKKNKRPKPIKRPGVVEEKPAQQFGSAATAVKQSEFWAIWNSDTTEDGGSDDDDPQSE